MSSSGPHRLVQPDLGEMRLGEPQLGLEGADPLRVLQHVRRVTLRLRNLVCSPRLLQCGPALSDTVRHQARRVTFHGEPLLALRSRPATSSPTEGALAGAMSRGQVRLEVQLGFVCPGLLAELRVPSPEPGHRLALLGRHGGEPIPEALDPVYESPAYLVPARLYA